MDYNTLFASHYKGKRVFVTGHTGFKGAWLCEWLLKLGAEVTGLALPPETTPSLFQQLDLANRMDHHIGDIRNPDVFAPLLEKNPPDYVFHLAAQPLVRLSYEIPVETYATNVMGTIHLLEALRKVNKKCAAVFITTDKCYENREWLHGYREEDPLGGYDPYSSSKAAAEIAISSWRRSFFSNPDSKVAIASVRAGNVIGGGDWALDRIVPDCIRALQQGAPIPVRNKVSTRPWQHVLEPLSGYLVIGAKLYDGLESGSHEKLQPYASAFNFGPNLSSNRTVEELVLEVLKHYPGTWQDKSDPKAVHEAGKLNLATDKAFHLLSWEPRWDFAETIQHTVEWYRAADSFSPEDYKSFIALTRGNIEQYCHL